MLNVDAPGIGAGQITDKLLVRWWILEWILSDDSEQCLSLVLES